MEAVIATGGKQYRVAPGQVIKVERLGKDKGAPVEFTRVLLVNNEGQVTVEPKALASARVFGQVVAERAEFLRSLGLSVGLFRTRHFWGNARRTCTRRTIARCACLLGQVGVCLPQVGIGLAITHLDDVDDAHQDEYDSRADGGDRPRDAEGQGRERCHG